MCNLANLSDSALGVLRWEMVSPLHRLVVVSRGREGFLMCTTTSNEGPTHDHCACVLTDRATIVYVSRIKLIRCGHQILERAGIVSGTPQSGAMIRDGLEASVSWGLVLLMLGEVKHCFLLDLII